MDVDAGSMDNMQRQSSPLGSKGSNLDLQSPSNSDGDGEAGRISSESADGDELGPDDDLTSEHLVHVLKECFRDEWWQQLHKICMYSLHVSIYIIDLAWVTGNEELTDDDLDNISAFALLIESSGLPRGTFSRMWWFFRHWLKLDTECIIHQRLDFLSGLAPVLYDICVNSCCLYVEEYKDNTHCSFCNTPRHNMTSKPTSQFSYLPLIPRLQGMFECPDMVRWMNYRHTYQCTIREISNIFDAKHYQSLRSKHVVIDGMTLGHKYFEDRRDIALGVSTDGFQVSWQFNKLQ
jgi:hypothetical protein